MKLKLLLLGLIIAAIATFFAFGGQDYLSLEAIKAQQADLLAFYADHQFATIAVFFLTYTAVTALSLPVATILTLLAGALFGLGIGLLIASYASTIGATLAFLMARFFLRDYVQEKYGDHLATINDGVKKEGAFYLFALRLTPVVPFFVVNALMALTPMKARTFYLVSQIGMLAGTAVYVYAGTELASIESLGDIASPSVIAAFVALGVFPLVAKKLVGLLQKNKAQA